jgi:ParB family chromosome partitioning protein
MPPSPKKPRRKKADAGSRGLDPQEIASIRHAAAVDLGREIEADGGASLAEYKDPLSGRPVVFAILPVDQVEPTPYQRDLSESHLRRLVEVIDKVGIYLDPIIATREGPRRYWTPNGSHRLAAMKKLGVKAITALVLPEKEVSFKILALNTEKSHNLKEKSLEVIRMARALADGDRKESDLQLEFEEPVLLTLGVCYEQNGRFAGAGYRAALKRVEAFLDEPLAKALKRREARGQSLLALDVKVTGIIERLKARGITSPYLRAFVTARINPIRFAKTVSDTPEELLAKMHKAADKFDTEKVRADQVTASAGYVPDESD